MNTNVEQDRLLDLTVNGPSVQNVGVLGERGIIDKYITPMLGKRYGNIPLDDCAILKFKDSTLFVSTDQVPTRSFLEILNIGTPADIGHFHVTINVSDIAAMGGRPIGITLAMALNGEESTDYICEYFQGINQAMLEYDLDLLGGDTKQASTRSTTITILGCADYGPPLIRRGAGCGDQIFISPGEIGHCLSNYISVARQQAREEPRRIVRPTAEIQFGRLLSSAGFVTSCMDMSDGLIASAMQLEEINDVAFFIDIESVPCSVTPDQNRELSWRNLILNTGGDFGLIFTASRDNSKRAESMGAVKIGEVMPRESRLECRNALSEAGIEVRGWEHFKTVGEISDEILSFT